MPASRKRNKGKDRKAKKEEIRRMDAHTLWRFASSGKEGEDSCIVNNHGFDIKISDDHPVSGFMDTFFMNWNSYLPLVDSLVDSYEKHPQVWDNEKQRTLTIDIMTTIGTNMLIRKEGQFYTLATCIAEAIYVMENYYNERDVYSAAYNRRSASKRRDLDLFASSLGRDVLKFYSKRVSCSCLKAMYSEARKKMPKKMGKCSHIECKVEKERVMLFVCGRCMIDQYCSRECQIAEWPKHKHNCDIHVEIHDERIEDGLA